ncbi:unnamed protein product, partial [Tetraodon nigroviridis]
NLRRRRACPTAPSPPSRWRWPRSTLKPSVSLEPSVFLGWLSSPSAFSSLSWSATLSCTGFLFTSPTLYISTPKRLGICPRCLMSGESWVSQGAYFEIVRNK